MLNIGDRIPLDIQLVDLDRKKVTLQDFLGKYLVLYFYPKDDTTDCTIEACAFRDANDEITALGASIIGISKDNPSAHQKFKAKYNLNFHLLSDPNKELQEAIGNLVEKSMYGKKYMGTQRSTFIIDPTGKILYVWEKVADVNTHTTEVLQKLTEIMN
jgi:peroxiredoxin Q/BCP